MAEFDAVSEASNGGISGPPRDTSTPLQDEINGTDPELNTPPPAAASTSPGWNDPPLPPCGSPTPVPNASTPDNPVRAARCCGVVCGIPAPQLHVQPWTTASITSWRATASGMVWHVLDTFCGQGHVGIDHDTMRIMHRYLPPVDGNEESLPVVILAVQVLATIRHGHYVLTMWARRDGRPVPPTRFYQPEYTAVVDGGLLELQYVGVDRDRYQPLPSPTCVRLGDRFLDSIRDVDASAGQHPWVVSLVVFVALSPWAWQTIFRG